MSRRPLVYLIDSHVQIFRAYYSMPELLSQGGSPVGAVRGYLAQLVRFIARQEPTHVAACWDQALESFRNELYADYKQGRTEAPEDLEPQFDLCARATRALGIPLYEYDRHEADDVIATLTGELVDQGARVAIVTTDKDLSVLVSDRVTLFDLKKELHIDATAIEEKFGVPPELVSEYLSLAGDSVDNIPGVSGIGGKTAAGLLNHFGSIDAIPEDFEGWAGFELRGAKRVHQRLQDDREMLELSRELVRLREDLPLRPKLNELSYAGANHAELSELLDEIGGRAVLGRVPKFQQ